MMQVVPATGATLKVGDIRVVHANIHAGIKYLDQLMTRFSDAHFSETDQSLFAFASYNAGPSNTSRMRKLASERDWTPTSSSTTWRSSRPKRSGSRRPPMSETSTSTT